MKIAYLANVRFPSERAHAVQIAHMCEAFQESGAEVTLFANTRVQGGVNEIAEYFKLPATFSFRRLNHGFFSPQIRLSYYVSEAWFTLNFLFFQKPKQYEIIYSRHEWVLWILSFFVPIKKLVWESHEAHYSLPARKILKKGVRTIVISEGILEAYKKKGYTDAQFVVAHDGIDESFFAEVEKKDSARTRLGLPLDKTIAMYIGGFDGWKGVETFFAAATHCPEILFVAIGGSEAQVASYSARYPQFLGSRPYAELKNNQQAADVLVVPNSATVLVSSEYTSPLKLFAHMASGVPLIVSDIPSLTRVTGRELVTVFEADNAESLASSIVKAISKKEQAYSLKQQALGYTWKNRAKGIIEFLRQSKI
jgi:glycosyltransferase involved in cell wall biosynthesis